MRKIYLFLIITFFGLHQSHAQTTNESAPQVRNVILLIGDGMGVAQVYAGLTACKDNLAIAGMPVTGFSKTFSLDQYITDSAAGGTALACGKKTGNGVLAMDTLGNNYKTILEIAEEKNYATGLVSTSAITHATPASFIAHQPSRGSYEAIAVDFLDTDIDVFIGGGLNHFSKRNDGVNLLEKLKKNGYEIITDTIKLLDTKSLKIAALLADEHLPAANEGRGNMLPKSTKKSIEVLQKNKNGFFLMVEGSQIDWACHSNKQEYMIAEMLDFDRAVKEALDFAKMDGNTLVIVTADHETGGVTITGGDLALGKVSLKFSTGDHTAVMVPVFAFGPGSEKFTGVYNNTAIFDKMMEAFGFSNH